MTEDQWRTTRARPVKMFDFVAGRLSRRQCYLIGGATYRADRWCKPDQPWHFALDCLERYAEGRADEAEFRAARDRIDRERAAPCRPAVWDELAQLFTLDTRPATRRVVAGYGGGRGKSYIPVRAAMCDLIREIAGNPFRPWKAVPEAMGGGLVQPDGATVFPSPTARAIAAGIAADQAFDRLPVLADALEDSGVTDAELLEHCRRPGGHLRGCWAVDVVLGRT
jgi:hypothetical protein